MKKKHILNKYGHHVIANGHMMLVNEYGALIKGN
jgi:hypothetical protein